MVKKLFNAIKIVNVTMDITLFKLVIFAFLIDRNYLFGYKYLYVKSISDLEKRKKTSALRRYILSFHKCLVLEKIVY